jgi:hypothetical protein
MRRDHSADIADLRRQAAHPTAAGVRQWALLTAADLVSQLIDRTGQLPRPDQHQRR